jgi:hypothetical protein
MLAVGNYLNCKTNRGNARAFRIENIDKTYLLLGHDKETSLFEYILEIIYRQNSQLFDYPTLTDKQKSVVSLSILNEDYLYFESKCQLVNQCILLSEENAQDESAEFFLKFYLEAREEISNMKKKYDEATNVFRTVKEYYGDKLESEEMARFVLDFRNRVNQFKSKRIRNKN